MGDKMRVGGACYCSEVTINGTATANKVMASHFTDCQKISGAPPCAVGVVTGLLGNRLADLVVPIDDRISGASHLTG